MHLAEDGDFVVAQTYIDVPPQQRETVLMYLGACLQDAMSGQILKKADPSFNPDQIKIDQTDQGIRVTAQLDKIHLYLPLD